MIITNKDLKRAAKNMRALFPAYNNISDDFVSAASGGAVSPAELAENKGVPQATNAAIANIPDNQLDLSAKLWTALSDRWVDNVRRLILPLQEIALNIQPEYNGTVSGERPVLSVEVINGIGDAIVNPTRDDYYKTEVNNSYVQIATSLLARPFALSIYDLMRGERIESKAAAAMNAIANGVMLNFWEAVSNGTGADVTTLTEWGPQQAAEISGAFPDTSTHMLFLSPALYSKLIPYNTEGMDPAQEGAYGIGRIYKTDWPGKDTQAPFPANTIIAMARDAVAGVMSTPTAVSQLGTFDAQQLMFEEQLPMLKTAHFEWGRRLDVCLETLCGFKVLKPQHIKVYQYNPPTGA